MLDYTYLSTKDNIINSIKYITTLVVVIWNIAVITLIYNSINQEVDTQFIVLFFISSIILAVCLTIIVMNKQKSALMRFKERKELLNKSFGDLVEEYYENNHATNLAYWFEEILEPIPNDMLKNTKVLELFKDSLNEKIEKDSKCFV
jgi:hypothetical protein